VIEPVLKSFITDISTCDAAAKQHAVSLFNDKFMSGQPISDWLDNICGYGFGRIEAKGTRLIGLAGDKALVHTSFTAEAFSDDVVFGFKKTNGVWKLMADKVAVPFDDPQVRHAFSLNLNSGNSTKALFQYERYIDIWTDKSNYSTKSYPNSVEIFVFGVNEAASKWSANNFPTTPDIVMYASGASCSNAYAFDATRKDCNAQATDTKYPSLFSKLESNPYSLAVYKFKDANGLCLNCDVVTGLPESGGVWGNAKTVVQLFGTTVTASQLSTSAGITPNAFPADAKANAKRYFSMPSDSQIETITNTLLSPTISNSLTVPLSKPTKFNVPIDGVWGGTTACGNNNPWVNAPDVSLKASDTAYTYSYNNPTSKTFSNAGSISLALSYKKDMSEYVFYINANRRSICTN
jgi:hypothetical protein